MPCLHGSIGNSSGFWKSRLYIGILIVVANFHFIMNPRYSEGVNAQSFSKSAKKFETISYIKNEIHYGFPLIHQLP